LADEADAGSEVGVAVVVAWWRGGGFAGQLRGLAQPAHQLLVGDGGDQAIKHAVLDRLDDLAAVGLVGEDDGGQARAQGAHAADGVEVADDEIGRAAVEDGHGGVAGLDDVDADAQFIAGAGQLPPASAIRGDDQDQAEHAAYGGRNAAGGQVARGRCRREASEFAWRCLPEWFSGLMVS